MKLLSILFGTFLLAIVLSKIITGNWNWLFSGNLGMSAFMAFTGLAHFRFQKGMAMMIPDFIPWKMFWVYATGIIEILLAIGLMIPEIRQTSAVLLILFLIIVFTANIHSSQKRVNLFKADNSGPGMAYLFRQRLPMQLILIAWTWFFGIYLAQI